MSVGVPTSPWTPEARLLSPAGTDQASLETSLLWWSGTYSGDDGTVLKLTLVICQWTTHPPPYLPRQNVWVITYLFPTEICLERTRPWGKWYGYLCGCDDFDLQWWWWYNIVASCMSVDIKRQNGWDHQSYPFPTEICLERTCPWGKWCGYFGLTVVMVVWYWCKLCASGTPS